MKDPLREVGALTKAQIKTEADACCVADKRRLEARIAALEAEVAEDARRIVVSEEMRVGVAQNCERIFAQRSVLETEVAQLRALFDATRHAVLRGMGVADLGHGWAWIGATLAEQRAELARMEHRQCDLVSERDAAEELLAAVRAVLAVRALTTPAREEQLAELRALLVGEGAREEEEG